MNNQWFVIQCSGGQEDLVGQRLYDRGYLSFCPSIIENGRVTAMFSTYLFGLFDVDTVCRGVLATIGVRRILGVVKVGVVEELILESGDDGVFRVETESEVVWRGSVGDEVRVKSGSFAGIAGRIEAVNNLRARVKIALLGGDIPISLLHEEIEPALLAAPAGNSRQRALAYNRYDRAVRGRR